MARENQLTVILEEQAVGEANAQRLLEAFGAPFEEAGEILADYQTIKVTDESDTATMAEARKKRLALKNVRVAVEKKRKELKEDIVKQGRAIDSVARFVKEVITPAEAYLQLQEDYAKIKAQERAAAIKAKRIEELSKYADPQLYNLDAMDEEQFSTLVADLKNQAEERAEAERKAEIERKAAEEAERKRQAEIAAEYDRLKKEAEEREAELAKQRAKAEEERRAREALEAEQRRLEAEKEAALARERAEREEAERAAKAAPDKQKLLTFAQAIATIRAEKLPQVITERAQAIVDDIDEALHHIEKAITSKAGRL